MFSSMLGLTPNQTTSSRGNQSLLCHRVISYDICKRSAGIQQKHLQIERRRENCFHEVLFIDSQIPANEFHSLLLILFVSRNIGLCIQLVL